MDSDWNGNCIPHSIKVVVDGSQANVIGVQVLRHVVDVMGKTGGRGKEIKRD